MRTNSHSFVHTNLRVFYQIAREAHVAMGGENLTADGKANLDDQQGRIVKYDPGQKSFKNALVTIVFCGVFLEALLHLLIVKRKGIEVFRKYDHSTYEVKLKQLGCSDKSILDGCKHYREARKEVVHEKAHIDSDKIRIAQKEASTAMELIEKILAYFHFEMG